MNQALEQQIQRLEEHLSNQPQSPRFAELASYYLEAGRAQDALNLCDQGLAHYPFYSTAHLVKGKILLALNMRAEARREFELVRAAVPNSSAVVHYLKQIPPTDEEILVGEAMPSTEISEAAPTAEEPSVQQEPQETSGEVQVTETQQLEQLTEEAFPQEQPSYEQTPDTTILQPSEEPQETPPAETTAEDVFGITEQSETVEQPEVFSPEEPATTEPPAIEEPSVQPEAAAGESFEDYAQRKRIELMGSEDMISLDEYLAGPGGAGNPEPPTEVTEPSSETEDPFAQLSAITGEETTASTSVEEPPAEQSEDPFAALKPEEPDASSAEEPPRSEQPAEKDQIEEITEKLKDARKITPVINLSDRTSSTASDDSESPTGTGFVTPTLAEIYAKQGWYDDAIKAYRALAASKPADKEKYETRIRELEELKNQQGSQET